MSGRLYARHGQPRRVAPRPTSGRTVFRWMFWMLTVTAAIIWLASTPLEWWAL